MARGVGPPVLPSAAATGVGEERSGEWPTMRRRRSLSLFGRTAPKARHPFPKMGHLMRPCHCPNLSAEADRKRRKGHRGNVAVPFRGKEECVCVGAQGDSLSAGTYIARLLLPQHLDDTGPNARIVLPLVNASLCELQRSLRAAAAALLLVVQRRGEPRTRAEGEQRMDELQRAIVRRALKRRHVTGCRGVDDRGMRASVGPLRKQLQGREPGAGVEHRALRRKGEGIAPTPFRLQRGIAPQTQHRLHRMRRGALGGDVEREFVPKRRLALRRAGVMESQLPKQLG